MRPDLEIVNGRPKQRKLTPKQKYINKYREEALKELKCHIHVTGSNSDVVACVRAVMRFTETMWPGVWSEDDRLSQD